MKNIIFVLTQCLLLSSFAAEVELSWQPNPERDLAKYRIYVSKNGGEIVIATEVNAPKTNVVVVGLEPGVPYTFWASAIGWTGLEGILSNPVEYAPPAPLELPRIISHPTNQLAIFSAPVTFSVVAVGTQPIAYQWFRNGVVIPGATAADYVIFEVRDADEGNFSVQISNSVGSIMSNTAVLKVKHIPPGQVKKFERSGEVIIIRP